MGGFAPAATAAIAFPLLGSTLSGPALWGFALMTAGGFFMFFSENLPFRKILPLIVTASAFFGMSNVLQKLAFNRVGFVTGYVFFSIGLFVASLCFLLRKKWREEIFVKSDEAQPRNKISYFSNRVVSGVGALLIVLAVSRADPSLVSAVAGLRYALVFAGVYFVTKWRPRWLHEEFKGSVVAVKVIATSMVIAGLFLAGESQNSGGRNASSPAVRVFEWELYSGESNSVARTRGRAAESTEYYGSQRADRNDTAIPAILGHLQSPFHLLDPVLDLRLGMGLAEYRCGECSGPLISISPAGRTWQSRGLFS